ncbi:MAG TPA: hypothetical protein PLA68_13080 [Panacibacter sp.]|nr:hypothetical protein [Panacibacter sp.]
MNIINAAVLTFIFALIANFGKAQTQLYCPVHNMKILSENLMFDTAYVSLPIVKIKSDQKKVYSLIEGIVKNVSADGSRLTIVPFDSSFKIILYSFDSIKVHSGDTLKPGTYLGSMIKIANKVYVLSLFYSEKNKNSGKYFLNQLSGCRLYKKPPSGASMQCR